jgi:hypothetical protein
MLLPIVSAVIPVESEMKKTVRCIQDPIRAGAFVRTLAQAQNAVAD